MALEQTLGVASVAFAKQFLCFPSTSSRNPTFFSCPLKSKAQKHRRLRLRCSKVYPKPTEIPWKKEICNSVQLIGNVGTPVEIKHLASGKTIAWTDLAARKWSTETSWVNLMFFDELANVAYEHVQKGHQISVFGRLVSKTVKSYDGQQKMFYKVYVEQLNFVEQTISPTRYDCDNDNKTAGRKPSNGSTKSQKSIEELWQAFFANPVEWWDNRKDKVTSDTCV